MRNLKYILIAAIVAITLSSCGYNTMVSKQEGVNSQWANVENAYQRRADLIPNLVNTVKGYAQHEQETFTQVTEARARATQMTVNPENLTEEAIQQYQQAQGQLGSAIGRLLLIQENYPELKANQNFLQLQDQLSVIESDIEKSRRYYNGTVREKNIVIDTFPSNIVANMFKFEKSPFFELENEAEKAVPQIKF